MAHHPPQIHYNQPPYACVPLPRQFAQPPALDPMLERFQRGAAIAWSVSECPSTAVARMELPYGHIWQNRPATNPPTSSLTIYSKPTGDRPIVLVKQSYVTVGDVLVRVHQEIRCAAREYYQPTPQPLLFHPQTYHQPPNPIVNEQQMRHWVLAYLNGRYTWAGLRLQDPESWYLDIR
ncbi:hypothetical protein AN958_02730 [Leucoagaricus sp. SymC.cos]|nr:hypothetical protein AN958_02730 [Leucoagaricus sp. SymC.cos]